MDRVKKLKIQLSAAIFVFFCIIIFGGFFSPDFKNFALALSPNYSKTLPGATLNLTEWNNLDDDFVAKSGDAMTGILNMSGNKIINLATPSAATDAANKSYVDAQIALIGASGSGSTYTNWGVATCPSGSDLLYSGVAFGSNTAYAAGSSNMVCMDSLGAFGGDYTYATADMMYPAITADASSLPTSILPGRIVRCAVCRRSGTCYESFGGRVDASACNQALGFNPVYTGYVLGAYSSGASHNPTQRICVNSSFDGSVSAGSTNGALLYGARINNNLGLSVFTTNAFINCLVCCN